MKTIALMWVVFGSVMVLPSVVAADVIEIMKHADVLTLPTLLLLTAKVSKLEQIVKQLRERLDVRVVST